MEQYRKSVDTKMNDLPRTRSLPDKVEQICRMLRVNGLVWTAQYVIHRFLSKARTILGRRLSRLERDRLLPGYVTADETRQVWERYDWRSLGEEWTYDRDWKRFVTQEVLQKHVRAGKTVLEIGPGAGRWTEILVPMSQRVILVDISDKAISLCKERFSEHGNVQFYVNQGSNLEFIPSSSVDIIWSFDVFVVINCSDADRYAREFHRVLRPGGVGIVNAVKEEYSRDSWPAASLNDRVLSCLLGRHGLRLLRLIIPPIEENGLDRRRRYFSILVFEKRGAPYR